MFTKEKGHESDRVKNLTKEFFTEYKQVLNTYNCNELKAEYRNDDVRCWIMIEKAAEILGKIIIREKGNFGL
jgi:C_GCAxxG_C_C family probable redox protein